MANGGIGRSSAALAALLCAAAAACGGAAATGDAGGEGDEANDVAADADVPGGEDAGEADADVHAPTACELASAPSVETVALLSAGRYAPSAAVLADGRALIAAGYDFDLGAQRSAELFDPATNTLAPTGDLREGRNFAATAVALDGTVLLFGGWQPALGSDTKVEEYDPAAGTWRFAANAMGTGREAHTATRLPDGRVLVAGGLQALHFTYQATAELFDPVAETFAYTAAPMNEARAFHAAALLADGSAVLLVGGKSADGESATAERYVVATDDFRNVAGVLPHAANAVAAVLLADGTVLVAGGANAADGTLADAERYDPATDRFTPTGSMAVRRMAHTLTRLADGRVLAAGGWSDSSSPSASTGALEVYDPAAGTWTELPVALASPRHDHIALLLPDCRVLVAGGQTVVGPGVPTAPLEVELVTVPRR